MPQLDPNPSPTKPAPDALELATPQLGGRVVDREPAPLDANGPPFWITVHPHRWGVLRGRIVPIVRRFKASPGANGVDEDRDRRPIVTQAHAELVEHGWTIIPWDIDGPGTSYLRRVAGTGGWVDRWTKVYAGSASQTYDEDGFTRWLEELIAKGVVKPCPLFVLNRLEADTQRTIEKLILRGAEAKAERIEGERRNLATIRAAKAKIEPAPSEAAELVQDEPELGVEKKRTRKARPEEATP